MASRFPSIEDFDPSLDEQLAPSGGNPNLDFLQREQNALGELFDTDASNFPELLDADPAQSQFEKSFPALDNEVKHASPHAPPKLASTDSQVECI